MNSGGHRGFTVVTVVTLIFAPIFAHHHWMWKFVGKTKETQIVQCVPKHPCPKRKVVVKIVKQQAPVPPPRGRRNNDDDDANAVDNPDAVGSSYADDGDDGNGRDGGHQNRH